MQGAQTIQIKEGIQKGTFIEQIELVTEKGSLDGIARCAQP